MKYIEKWFTEIYGLGETEYMKEILKMYVERIHVIPEIRSQIDHFFKELPEFYDQKQIRRRYKNENENIYQELFDLIRTQKSFDENHLKDAVNRSEEHTSELQSRGHL